jgi:feruloyl-CoA synthase
MEEPPSLDAGEVTDKGSLNQRAILARRESLVDDLYTEDGSQGVIRACGPSEH